jgi:hypothetical protein
MFQHGTRLATEKRFHRPPVHVPFAMVLDEDMPNKRKTISKKDRFEVFKRDGFKCQYCGATAPEAVLVVDHIHPVSKDGEHDVMNFITACQPCNAGKSDRTLSDDSVIQKQRGQLEELNARREQLEMMLEWRNALKDIEGDQLSVVLEAWSKAAPGWNLTDTGKKKARALLRKHALSDVLDAIDRAAEQYLRADEDGKLTSESVDNAWLKVGGILRVSALPEDQRRLFYIRGILRNRLRYVAADAVAEMQRALDAGVPVDEIQDAAKSCSSWTAFLNWIDAEVERN